MAELPVRAVVVIIGHICAICAISRVPNILSQTSATAICQRIRALHCFDFAKCVAQCKRRKKTPISPSTTSEQVNTVSPSLCPASPPAASIGQRAERKHSAILFVHSLKDSLRTCLSFSCVCASFHQSSDDDDDDGASACVAVSHSAVAAHTDSRSSVSRRQLPRQPAKKTAPTSRRLTHTLRRSFFWDCNLYLSVNSFPQCTRMFRASGRPYLRVVQRHRKTPHITHTRTHTARVRRNKATYYTLFRQDLTPFSARTSRLFYI